MHQAMKTHRRVGVQLQCFLHWAVDKIWNEYQRHAFAASAAEQEPPVHRRLGGSQTWWALETPIILWGLAALINLWGALWDLEPFWTLWYAPSIDFPPSRWETELIIGVKYPGGGAKGKNKCITSNFRHEAGVLYNLYYKWKSNFVRENLKDGVISIVFPSST